MTTVQGQSVEEAADPDLETGSEGDHVTVTGTKNPRTGVVKTMKRGVKVKKEKRAPAKLQNPMEWIEKTAQKLIIRIWKKLIKNLARVIVK